MSTNHNLRPTLIFIPDISGYTNFINSVEIQHSTHIISELLEIILSANTLNLKVSEIEGDAVLFYRFGTEPSFKELLQQVEKMYAKFHQHLQFYKRDRICQCGACATANDLSLKFVYHYGVTTIRKIGIHEKLFGSDVTLTHKLLKNNIPIHDYLLLTSPPQFSEGFEKPDWAVIEESEYDYSGIGEVRFNYIALEPIRESVAELPSRSQFHSFGRSVSATKKMDISLIGLHGIVTDVSVRPKWIFGLNSVQEEGDQLDKIGSKHLCIMPTNQMEFAITSQRIEEGMIEYVEQTNSIKWLAPLNEVFILKKITDQTSSLTIHIHYRRNWLAKLYLDFPLRWMMAMMLRVSLSNLQRYISKLPAYLM